MEKTLTIAICDDDKAICEDTRNKVLEIYPKSNISCCYTKDELFSHMHINEQHDDLRDDTTQLPDILFLDIEIVEDNGLRIAETLRDNGYDGYLIFMTNHEKYVYDAFKVDAYRFLRKPINTDELREAITSIKDNLKNEYISLTDLSGNIRLIHLSDIVYIQANRNNSIVVTIKDTYEFANSMKNWREKYPDVLYRTHKSFLVSFAHIEHFSINEICTNFGNVPVSRRTYKEFTKKYDEYVKKNMRKI